MAKSFVYNSGKSHGESTEHPISLTLGIFMDGTLNNKDNIGFHLTEVSTDQTKEQRAHPKQPLWLRLAVGAGQSSYTNDFTNIARMWQWCSASYRIYIAGPGTESGGMDEPDGYLFGAGTTGIRARVREACERVAAAVMTAKKLGMNQGRQLATLTLDVFGFSRGAAAARSFLYEVNVKSCYPPNKQHEPVITRATPTGSGAFAAKPVYRDADGAEVEQAFLLNSMMPARGHLGYSLLKLGMEPDELKGLKLNIRFVGLYDTVAAYASTHDATDTDTLQNRDLLAKTIKHIRHGFNHHAPALHLNQPGRAQKIVHLTAADEHRRNFALNHMPAGPGCIEHALPGCHSDIGGGYQSGVEEQELENSVHFPNGCLEFLIDSLVEAGWFRMAQVRLVNDEINKWTAGMIPRKVCSKRFVFKEYSYLALHLMQEYCKPYLGKALLANLQEVFTIQDHPILAQLRANLVEPGVTGTAYAGVGQIFRAAVCQQTQSCDPSRFPVPYNAPELFERRSFSENPPTSCRPSVIENDLLHKLRNQYLHWPASRSHWGQEPEYSRIRTIN